MIIFGLNKKQKLDIALFLCIVVMAVCAFIALSGCSSAEVEPNVDIGETKQEISAMFAATNDQSRFFTYGVCQHYTRQKCQKNSQCPSNAACIVPKSAQIVVRLEGPDDYPSMPGISWKYQVRRALDETLGISNFPDMLADDGGSAMGWTFSEEVPGGPAARLIIRNVSNGWPCHEGAGSFAGCANKITNWMRFSEGSLTTLTEMQWTQQGLIPGSYPGTYKRPTNFTTTRTVELNVNGLADYIQEWYIPAEFEQDWDNGVGPFHFALEHMARTAILTAIGVGFEPAGLGFGAATGAHEGSGGADGFRLMSPWLWKGDPSPAGNSRNFAWNWNAANWVEPWESCQLRNYSTVDGDSSFWQAPAGCTIP